MMLTSTKNNRKESKSAVPVYHHKSGYRDYPPSILICGEASNDTTQLKHTLERNGCQVSHIGPSTPENLTTIYRDFFDLIVLNLEQSRTDQLDEVWTRLNSDPKLSNIPLAIIAGTQDINKIDLGQSNVHPSVYCLSKDIYLQTKLLQIVQQTQYLSSRYM